MADASTISSYLGYTPEVTYVVASSIVVLLYDLTLTFEREVRLVWKAPWNLAKGLFLFLRYFFPICVILIIVVPLRPTNDVRTNCLIFSAIFTITTTLSKCVVDLLMLIRVYAIWNRSAKILACMGVLYTITNISNGVAGISYLITMKEHVMHSDACFRPRASALIYICWASSLAYDTFAFLFTLIRGVYHWRAKHIQSPLLYVFYRDGLGYFGVLTLLRTLTIIGSTVENLILFVIATYFVRSLTITFTIRMFLNLRSVRTHEDWCVATNMRYAESPKNITDETT